MSELFVRTLSGVVMMAIALVAVAVGGHVFAVLCAATATIIYYEWSRIVRGWGVWWNIAGFLYALAPALALLWIRDRAEHSIALLVWVLIVTWSTDIGAYFAGRRFGGRRLAQSISPAKTYAGLYGGMAVATLVGGAWVLWTGLEPLLIVAGPIFAIVAQAGDLFESWMKRRAGVKDSANWLPGHGGLLDRLDGLVPVAVLTVLLELAGLA